MRTVPALGEAIDELHEVDVQALPEAEREELALDVDRQLARLTAEHARVIAAVATSRTWAADGSKSCAAWLARKTNGCRSTAAAALRLGESLENMPLVAVALHAGDITLQHARLLSSCRRFKPDAFGEAEEELLGYATSLRFHQFVMVCARWREAVDPDGAERRADKLYDSRHLILNRRYDGSLEFQSGLMDPLAAEAFLAELESIEHDLFEDDWAEAKARWGNDVAGSKLRRTKAQRRVDALLEMAYRSSTAPSDGKRPARSSPSTSTTRR